MSDNSNSARLDSRTGSDGGLHGSLEAAELSRHAIELAPLAVFVVDEHGRIALTNRAAVELFGYDRDELIGEQVEVLLPSRARHAHPGLRLAYFDQPEVRQMGAGRDLFAARKDGSEFPVEIGLSPIPIKKGLHVMATVVDISERLRLEDRFRATVESAPMAIVMIDVDGKIVLINQETQNQFGYARDELLGHAVEMLVPDRLQETHPEQRRGFFQSPKARRMGVGRELFGLRKDGSEFPVEIGLSPVRTAEGLFVLAVIVNITERKHLEDKVRDSHSALERSNVELKQFAYVASHDLQTPLRTVAGFAQILQEDYAGKLDDEADSHITRIVNGCQRMSTLINDLLSYSRVESRSQPFLPVKLEELFDDVMKMVEADLESVGGEVVCKTGLPKVMGDRGQLSQLLANLIGNGLKYHAPPPRGSS